MDLHQLQPIANRVSNCRESDAVLEAIVNGLADLPGSALARIWLVDEGDRCELCPFADECPDRTACLHLAASDGHSANPDTTPWRGTEGFYQRFPIGIRKVGRIAASRQPVLLRNIADDRDWIREPEWADREGITAFAGQPLIFRGELLGVLALFSRVVLTEADLFTLKIFADQAAAALANARAFEEIDRLRRQLEWENQYLREEVQEAHGFGDIVGSSAALRKVLDQIALVAPTDSNVLVTGETGTGKELVARAIHERSSRAGRPLIRVNCAAIPADLFESEFFGHARGAFTGANSDRAGRFELADGGTLFLDEVGEIPLALQGKLLRVLQEGTFERVGEGHTRTCDVRIVAATNRDLRADAQAGTFRQDLYFRLSVFPLDVPPLRDRTEDIPALAQHFLKQVCTRYRLTPLQLKQRHLRPLVSYDWPGNIRELQNVIERAAVTARHGDVRFDFPTEDITPRPPDPEEEHPVYTRQEWRALERENLLRALRKTSGKIAGPDGAAALLDMKVTTLASRVRTLKIDKANLR